MAGQAYCNFDDIDKAEAKIKCRHLGDVGAVHNRMLTVACQVRHCCLQHIGYLVQQSIVGLTNDHWLIDVRLTSRILIRNL